MKGLRCLALIASLAMLGNTHIAAENREEEAQREAMKQQRKQAAHRQRRIIFNNDGDDARAYAGKPTPQSLLECRTSPLLGSEVDTVFYSTTVSFGLFSHNSDVAEVLTTKTGIWAKNITGDLIEQGTDPLQVMADFCHRSNVEIFWSMRMNDPHDAWYPEMLPQFKKDHPEYLFATEGEPPKHGVWSGVDYGRLEVRERAFRVIQDVCERYGIDGIEMDFFRWPVLFKRHAMGRELGQRELDMMTGLLRRVRRMTEDVSLRRGRPLLVAVRVPDSVGYCEAIGLDLTRWLEDDLIDILVTSDTFRLTPWDEMVTLGHKYDVAVYPCVTGSGMRDDARQVRNSLECYRAQAMNVWRAGADGVYIFNFAAPHSPLWRELGHPRTLEQLDKVYCVSVRGFRMMDSFLGGADRFLRLPTLCPERPEVLEPGVPLVVPLLVGDNVLWGKAEGILPDIKLSLQVEGLAAAGDIAVTLNGQALSEGALSDGWLEYVLSAELVRKGTNRFEIMPATDDGPVLKDLQLQIRYEKAG